MKQRNANNANDQDGGSPTLPTRRLLLVPTRLSDADEIYNAYAQDPEVTRYLQWPTAKIPADTQRGIAEMLDRVNLGLERAWTLRLAATGDHRQPGVLIGMLGVRHSNIDGQSSLCAAEIGYLLAQPHWRRGYISEALARVLEWCLSQALNPLWAGCHPHNLASKATLLKAGFIHRGELPERAIYPNLSDQVQTSLRFEYPVGP